MDILKSIINGFAAYGEAMGYHHLTKVASQEPAPAKADAPKAAMQRPKIAWNEADAIDQMRGPDGKI